MLRGERYLVCIKPLEEINSLLEEVRGLLFRNISGIAFGIESTDACSVLAPLVLPKGLIIALIVLPICVHVVQSIALPELLEYA